ncbi:Fatty acid elongase [Oopsacas minuta]|uniref:Elongation of very long chain fatty acids protein n=1 Tax=Oopsacas minuta TaxID=111878 RepID=A0AAV7K6D1_9METZ|nr:Fatty acid elongase [Oopsacas minuta]
MERQGHNSSTQLLQLGTEIFSIQDGQNYIAANWTGIAGLLIFYVMVIMIIPKYFRGKRGLNLRNFSIFYNALMCLFSLYGASALNYQAKHILSNHNFYRTVCSCDYFFNYPSVLATFLFSWSKPVELIDTFILVFRAKTPIFLHWYHHVSVVIVSMNNYVNPQPTGLWCGVMNYSIHFLMYGYYAIMLTPGKKLVSSFSIAITTLQILQMLLAFIMHCYILYQIMTGGSCDATIGSIVMTGGVYLTYAFLFGKYFVDRYKTKSKKE